MKFFQRLKFALKCLTANNKSVLISYKSDSDILKAIAGKNYAVQINLLDVAIKKSLLSALIIDVAREIDEEKNKYELLVDYLELIQSQQELNKQEDALNEVYKILNNE
jgi:hypothetical protein